MRRLAALLAIALLAAPSVVTAQTAWRSSFFPRPTDNQVAAFVWLAAGCKPRAEALIHDQPNAMSVACDKTPLLDGAEARRIVELGILTGPVAWCEPETVKAERSADWLVAVLNRGSTDTRGKPWTDEPTGLYASRLTGVASGYVLGTLNRNSGDCTPEQKVTAHRELDAWLAKDAADYPAR